MERIVGGPGGGERITVLADGSALIDGLALVADVNAQFGLHIDEESYNTLGGYVLGRLGRRARVGDRFDVEGRTLRVEALDGLRVARVYLSKGKADRARPEATDDVRVRVALQRRSSAEAQPVGDDHQRRPRVGQDRQPQRRVAAHRQREEDHFHDQRNRDVGADGAHRRAAQAQRKRQLRQVVAHERDVGRFEGGVAADGAHHDADIGGGQRRRVVDAVADHRDTAPLWRASP